MRISQSLTVAAALAVAALGCQDGATPVAPDAPVAEAAGGTPGTNTQPSAAIITLPGLAPVAGTASLNRNRNGATFTYRAAELEPGHTYTVWWVVFENPAACGEDGCNGADLLTEGVGGTVFGPAAGGIAGEDGRATFAGSSLTPPSEVLDLNGDGVPDGDGSLDDTQGAEVHLVVRDHGPAIPGRVPEQIGSFLGGCDVF
ncbi:MAG: hypothetical protein RQ751_14270, partial [Longimicrobiales bacterium]|nr:hypothetical protein [Longimicrobiales bacterium]